MSPSYTYSIQTSPGTILSDVQGAYLGVGGVEIRICGWMSFEQSSEICNITLNIDINNLQDFVIWPLIDQWYKQTSDSSWWRLKKKLSLFNMT